MKTLRLLTPSDRAKDHYAFHVLSQDMKKLKYQIGLIQHHLDYQSKKIRIHKSGSVHFILISDIIYCQADGNYCIIYLKNGEKFISSKTLKKVERMISHPTFMRIHQSYLVNSEYIKSVEKASTRIVVIANGEVLPISRSFDLGGFLKQNELNY